MPLHAGNDFTDEEWIAALSLVFPPHRAREEALSWLNLSDMEDIDGATVEELSESEVAGPWSYDGDLLDLLSLVSDSCAERAWRLLGVTREEGERRRAAFRRRIEDARREMGWS